MDSGIKKFTNPVSLLRFLDPLGKLSYNYCAHLVRLTGCMQDSLPLANFMITDSQKIRCMRLDIFSP